MHQAALSSARRNARALHAWAWPGLVLAWAGLSIALWWANGRLGSMHQRGAARALWDWLDWQPVLWQDQIWRLWSAALVHWSGAHLALNVVGCAGLLVWGKAAGLGLRQGVAWLGAWPLTQLLLWTAPGLPHYGGLSGVLHAGVAIGAWTLVRAPLRARRWVGAWVLAGLLVKLMTEVAPMAQWLWPHAAPVPLPGAPGYGVAAYAHLCGVLAGLACAWLLDLASACVGWLGSARA